MTRRRTPTDARMLACASMLLAASIAFASTPAQSATSSSVVGATVLSATNIDTSGCATGTLGKTDFGPVTAGSSTVTTLDCAVTFGSSNDDAKLRIQQSDALGDGMWMPTKGALDTAFDTDGRVTTATAPGAGFDMAMAVAVQADDKVVTAGYCVLGGATDTDMCLARYTTTGALDPTFDTDGIVTTAIAPGASGDLAFALAVQADGKIVAAGYCNMGGGNGWDACLARYTISGALDPTFDTDGRVSTPTGSGGGLDEAASVVVQADGKIVTAGTCDMGGATGTDVCLARYTTTGALDTTFDTDGIVTTAIGPGASFDRGYAVAAQADGKIVTAGFCYPSGATGADMCLTRHTPTGALDPTFDTDGIVTTATGPGAASDIAFAVAIQGDGKILAAGQCSMGGATGADACLARYDTNGALDTTFDADGRVTTNIAPTNADDGAKSVQLQADGKILMAGECEMYLTGGIDACIARYTTTGALDPAFDSDGRVTTATAPGTSDDYAKAMAVRTDGSIVTAGACAMGGATGFDACAASYDQGGAVTQYAGGSADWTTPATSHFAACLRSIIGGTATWAANAGCPAANGAWWNAIPTTPGQLASEASATDATANLRFGLRTAPSQPAGDYIAPVTFTVVAP